VLRFTDEWRNMDFNWKSPAVPRVAILAFSLLLFGYFLFEQNSYLLALVFLVVSIFQVKQLITFFDTENKSIASFLDSIRFDDLSSSFKTESKDPVVQRLHRELNDAITKLRLSRQEKDSEFLFYKNIVMHVGIGLIIFKEDNGKVEIFNSAARRLLKVNRADTIHDFKEVSETLVNVFLRLKTGGRELLRLKIGDDSFQLSVYAIELTLRGENLKLISLQNIQSELDEKEMEAWQNLVRVLTHEIMNSVTPISSLAGIIDDEISQHIKNDGEKPLDKEQLADIHLSLHIPHPRPQSVQVSKLLEEISMLHRQELAEKNINLTIQVNPTDLTVMADKSMIEQVVINLLKNAMQAFDDDQETRNIQLKGYCNEKLRPVISVKDNGSGIDPDALEKIFIPFFTTKKSGSGIGLSLSRQIMRQHQGALTVNSVVGEGTEFYLRF
jgi:two-component system, NtrC family, nitrogen regulation sensor histidine kinase NtrY